MLESRGIQNKQIEKDLLTIETDIAMLKEKGIWQNIILPRKDSFAELPFMLNIENSVYSGRIDRIIRENNTYSIYDYKTSPVKDKEMGYYLKEYSAQLNIYKKAVRNLFDTNDVRSFIIFTHTGDVREI